MESEHNTKAVLRQREEGTELPGSAQSYEIRGSSPLSQPHVGGYLPENDWRAGTGRGFSWSQALSGEGGRGHSVDDVPGWEDVKEADNISEQTLGSVSKPDRLKIAPRRKTILSTREIGRQKGKAAALHSSSSSTQESVQL